VARPRTFDEEQAVQRAMLLFWRRGYAGTSVRDLGEELGLNPGSLYGAFGDKRGLFHQALDRYGQGQVAGLLAAVQGEEPLLPRLRALLLGVAETNRLAQGRLANGEPGPPPGCLMVATTLGIAADDAGAAQRVRDTFGRIDAALERALTSAVRRGELPEATDAAAAASFLTTFLQGLQVVSTADPGHARVPAAVDLALTAVSFR